MAPWTPFELYERVPDAQSYLYALAAFLVLAFLYLRFLVDAATFVAWFGLVAELL